jgi:cytidyltransferase-like protein
MTRVYADMVADLFHHGHVEFLRRARELGDELLVGIHSDDDVRSYKRTPVMTMDERVAVVRGCRYVDEVIPNAPRRVTRDWIERYGIGLVVHGDDFDRDRLMEMYGDPAEMGILRTVPYTPGISTSELRERLARQ